MAEKKEKIKLRCDQTSQFTYGEVAGFKHVNPIPVAKGKKDHENTKYAKDIPAATLEMQIALDSPLYKFFKPGEEYFFEVSKAKMTALNSQPKK